MVSTETSTENSAHVRNQFAAQEGGDVVCRLAIKCSVIVKLC